MSPGHMLSGEGVGSRRATHPQRSLRCAFVLAERDATFYDGRRLEAARHLTESAALAYDQGRRCDMEAGMAKLFASEAAMDGPSEAASS